MHERTRNGVLITGFIEAVMPVNRADPKTRYRDDRVVRPALQNRVTKRKKRVPKWAK